MLRLFKRKKSPTAGKTLSGIAYAIARAQLSVTSRLNRRTLSWSKRSKITFLVIFTSIMVTLALLQLQVPIRHATESSKKPPSPQQRSSQLPKDATSTFKKDSALFNEFLLRLQQLRATPEGRDSLARYEAQRPGFIDSVLAWGANINPNH
ncbi:hypothetical protein ACQKLP_10895 [Chitinophaga sp. NPDC101104]|uniref:hypothetical protein n=1 Tax=Chitinophaga sp. NPDC101104 TaxID=3390561 RepID=UPI003D02B2AB